MRVRLALFTIVAAAVHASAAAQAQAPSGQPIVYSGLFSMSADGKVRGSAAQTGEFVGDDLAGTLYLSPCAGAGASSTGRSVSAFATDVWAMSGKVLELTDQQASVQLGWRRTRRAGVDETSPEQSTTLTLRRGDRHTIETISVPAAGACGARTVQLDVVFASRNELYGVSDADFARGGSARAGGGRSTGSGSGERFHFAQGSAATGSGGGGGVSTGSGGPAYPGLRGLTADLWLVRSTPGSADQTLHVSAPLMPIPVSYAFAPMMIQTATGSVSVKVDGTIEAGLTPEGEQRLHFTASRAVTTVTDSRPVRDGQALSEGSTKTTLKMPGAEEVLSFEMPPLRTADGAILPDRLSIRVRVNAPPNR